MPLNLILSHSHQLGGSMNARFCAWALRFTCRIGHQSDRMRTCPLGSNGDHGAKSQAAGRRNAGLEGLKWGMGWNGGQYGGSVSP